VENHPTLESLRIQAAQLRFETARLEDTLAKTDRAAERLERIVAAVPGVVWESEGTLGQPDYRITYVGGQLERILGYTPQEWTETPTFWLSVIHPDDRATVMRDAVRGGRPPEHRFIARGGREVWVLPHVRVLRDEAGAAIGTSIFVMDVTERVRAEHARKELLERTQALTERLDKLITSMPGVVWESRGNAIQVPLFFSSYLTTLTGYLPAEAVGVEAVWQLLAHPDDWERASREIAERLAEGSGTVEYRWITQDGSVLWVESHVRAARNERGELGGAYGVTMDVTAHKLEEDERDKLKDEVIQAQADALAGLSTPLIPISREVLVMPLIGAIDEQRAANVIEVLLYGVSKARARVAILDITGVPSLDAQTADVVQRAAHAVSLLGAEVILSGIRPEVAATLVGLGTDLSGIVTCGRLESAIAYATRRRRAVAPCMAT